MKRSDSRELSAPYLQRLKQSNVKVTSNRRRVLDCFLEAEKPWTLRSLHHSLNQSEAWDLSSVYRTLETLRTAGILEEFRLPGDKQTHYSLIKHAEPRKVKNTNQPLPSGLPIAGSPGHATTHTHAHPQGHHHHIVCQDCGKVSHLDICVPMGWMGKVEETSGFRITEHHLEFKGVCAKCR